MRTACRICSLYYISCESNEQRENTEYCRAGVRAIRIKNKHANDTELEQSGSEVNVGMARMLDERESDALYQFKWLI